MCKGGGSSSSTIDPRIMQMLQQNYASAQGVASRPYQPYTGQLTAPLTDAQNQAGSLLQSVPMMGQGAIGTGIDAAAQGTQYQAPQVSSGFYNPAMAEAGMAGPSAQMTAAQTPGFSPIGATTAGAANAGPAAQATPFFYNPMFGNAASAGSAATINANQLPFLNAPNGLSQLSQYQNPYQQSVVDTTMNDLNRQNQIALNNTNQNATAENAFGGDRQAVAQGLTNDDYARAAASTLAGLNNQGFNTAAGLLQNNQQMGLQAGGQNLGAALSAAGQNANALNNMGQFNAGLSQNMGLTNLGFGNQAGQYNAGAANQAGLFNAGAANNMSQYNAGNQQQTALANMGALNNMGQFDLSNLLQNNQFNAANQQQANATNAAAANQFNLFNAGNQQQTNLANAGALNTGSQFNLNNWLQSQLANQSAANASQGLNLQAGGLLGALGTQQNQNYLAGTNALNAFGTEQQQTQQNALNAAYQQYLNQFNYPVQMQQLLNSALSGGMGAGTYNPVAAGQATGGLLGGLGSLGSAAAMLLPLL